MRHIATMRDLKGPPWKHDSELALVRDWFYPQHARQDAYSAPPPDMRKRAVSKINLYLFKAGDIPHAMLATANLTEAILHDSQPNREDHISYNGISSIYSMAFVKFVNGFVDRDVARVATSNLATVDTESLEHDNIGTTTPTVKGGGESSMYAFAAKIGMPEGFVDLRHEIVHGGIPELWYLREMTEKALDWLWEKWWVKNATGDPDRAMKEMELRTMEMGHSQRDTAPQQDDIEMNDNRLDRIS